MKVVYVVKFGDRYSTGLPYGEGLETTGYRDESHHFSDAESARKHAVVWTGWAIEKAKEIPRVVRMRLK